MSKMEKFKKRYETIEKLERAISKVLAVTLLVFLMQTIMLNPKTRQVLILIGILLVVYSVLDGINRMTLKNFFLEGCCTGENVFENYDVVLNRKGRSSLEVTAIYFKRDTFTNEIQVKYRNGMKEKIRIHELEFLREYIFFD